MSQHTVTIEVAKRKLKIACPAGKETALLSAAAEVTQRIDLSKGQATATNTPEQTLLMVALNLANELLESKAAMEQERQETQSKIELLQSTIEQALIQHQDKHA